jgi:hypothetical protein
MDDCLAIIIDDHTNLQRLAGARGADEHRDRLVVRCEGDEVVSVGVEHVVVVDAVLAGARLDVAFTR